MKAPILRLLFACILTISLTNCATVYDEYGNPQTVVTPEGALLGAAAVGVLAYALADDDDDDNDYDEDYDDHHHHDHGHSHGRSRHRRGYSSY